MISRREWDDFSAEQKWDYVYRYMTAAEQDLVRHQALLRQLQERLTKLEAAGAAEDIA